MVLLTEDQARCHSDLGMQEKIDGAVKKMVEDLKNEDEDDAMLPSQAVSEGGGSALPPLAAAVLRLVRAFITQHMLKYVIYGCKYMNDMCSSGFGSEPPPATDELPPKGAPLKRFGPGVTFNGEYTNAVDGYLEQRCARSNKDCVSSCLYKSRL